MSSSQYGLYAPSDYSFHPVRTGLLKELETELDTQPKVLSIIAPVGFGKTVLMSQLYVACQNAGRSCLWLGFDHQVLSASQIAQHLKTAISPEHENASIYQAPLSVEVPTESAVDRMVAAINRLTQPVTVFIDNLNSCEETELGFLLDALMFRTPPFVRFVWSSTTLPQFSQSHAKLKGLIRQIGLSELSLTKQETTEVLGASLAEQLGPQNIASVFQRTEGWPAGVRLAQIALSNSAHPAAVLAEFSGSDEDVASMLSRHVMVGFSSELHRFVCSLADINSFSIEMCAHITASSQAHQHIDLLLNRNVFLIPLDRNRHRYRFHRVFKEYLKGEADRLLSPQERNHILARASEWCEKKQQWQEAINYALAAGQYIQANRLLDHTGTLFVRDRGNSQQFIRWMEQVQGNVPALGWEAHFWFVWALALHRQYTFALEQLEVLIRQLRDYKGDEKGAPPADLPHRIDHLRICINIFTDHINAAHLGCEHWLATVKKCAPYNVGSVYRINAICLASSFKLTDARQVMRIADHIELATGSAYTVGWVDLIYGSISIYEGNFTTAHKELSTGLDKIRIQLGEDSPLFGLISLAGALCAMEMGKDQEAKQLLLPCLTTTHVHGLVDTVSYGIETAIKLWGDEGESLDTLDYLRDITKSYPPRLSVMLSCHLIQRLLRLGRLNEAFAEAECIGLSDDQAVAVRYAEHLRVARFQDVWRMTSIDLLIAKGALREASKKITQAYSYAQKTGLAARLVELNLNKLIIALQTDDTPTAHKALTYAVSTAAPRGILRPFIDHAPVLATLINDTRPSAWSFAHLHERTFFADICALLPISTALHNDMLGVHSDEPQHHIALTPKEIELLALLDTGLSNQQIADYREVSITTIKWHLKNLYRKLEVPNRVAALARARGNGMLTPLALPYK